MPKIIQRAWSFGVGTIHKFVVLEVEVEVKLTSLLVKMSSIFFNKYAVWRYSYNRLHIKQILISQEQSDMYGEVII